MAKKATTLHDNLGNDLLPVTNASITFMDNGNSVQAEIEFLTSLNTYKGHFTTINELYIAYSSPIEEPLKRKGWYSIVGETDTIWVWDIEGNKWVDSGTSTTSNVNSVNGQIGDVILTGGNINATATINETSKTELINAHLTDIYSELDNKVNLDSSQIITGTKVFTETIGLANTSEGTVDQIKHINNNFLITSGTGQNLLNIDEGLQTISAFNRELAYEDEIAEIQGNYVTKTELSENYVSNTNPTYIFSKGEYEKGLNKFDIPDKVETTTSGITYSISKGVITLNGTCNSEFTIYETYNQVTNDSGAMRLFYNKSSYPTGILVTTYKGSWNNYISINADNNPNGFIFNTERNHISIVCQKGAVFDNLQISLMIVDDDKIPTTFYAYNGKLCRTGDVEQEFLYDEYNKSFNLLGLPNVSNTTINGITYSINNGVITINGTASEYTSVSVKLLVDIDVGDYTFIVNKSGNHSAGSTYSYLGLLDSGKSTIFNINAFNNKGANWGLTKTAEYLYFDANQGTTFENYQVKPLLAKGFVDINTPFKSFVSGKIVHDVDLLTRLEVPERTKQYSFRTNASDSLVLNIDEIIAFPSTDSRCQIKIEGIRNGGGTTFALIGINSRKTDSFTLTVTSLGSWGVTATFDYTTQNLTINGLGAWGLYTLSIISL